MYSKTKNIEKRILEIDKILSDKDRRKKIGGTVVMSVFEKRVERANEPLLIEKKRLEMERQFILDNRNSFFWKVLWSVVVPILVTLIINYMQIKINLLN